jgi:hypothetical protein
MLANLPLDGRLGEQAPPPQIHEKWEHLFGIEDSDDRNARKAVEGSALTTQDVQMSRIVPMQELAR